MIYAIDFDGTIVKNKWPEIGELNPVAKKFITTLQEKGDQWILYTMREDKYLDDALAFLKENGLHPDAVNDNLPKMKDFYNNNPRKVFANVYIDDHNAGGLNFSRHAASEPEELMTAAQIGIIEKCDELKAMLLEKNRKYGNSALEPARIFSKASAVEQILVRIDDKLNRIKNRQNDEDEDVIMDLAGYLILLMVAKDGDSGK